MTDNDERSLMPTPSAGRAEAAAKGGTRLLQDESAPPISVNTAFSYFPRAKPYCLPVFQCSARLLWYSSSYYTPDQEHPCGRQEYLGQRQYGLLNSDRDCRARRKGRVSHPASRRLVPTQGPPPRSRTQNRHPARQGHALAHC
jgi:hypothetical protein